MRFYRFIAFISGLVVLAVEITALRVVAPFFGNSIFVTTNILGVILCGLALGYSLGGRLADKTKSHHLLYKLMLLSALIVALIPFVAPILLSYMREQITGVDWTLIVTSFIGSFILFFIPFVFLGLVSPWLVRLINQQVEQTGRSAGNIYAWSTLGSILGTFLPTFLLVPLVGSKRTILLLASILALTSAWGLAKMRWFLPGVILIAACFIVSPFYFSQDSRVIVERESPVQYLKVIQEDDSRVHLEQDEGIGVHSVYDQDSLKTGLVFDWFALAPSLNSRTHSVKKDQYDVGIIGLAAGTAARQYAYWYGPYGVDPHRLSIKGVELDTEVIDLAKNYFALNKTPVPIDMQVGDGRLWLTKQDSKFDVLILDAFRQIYIPPHLSSREFFLEVKQHLKLGGIAVVNLNTLGTETLVFKKMAATLNSVFPSVLIVKNPDSYNVLFYVSNTYLNENNVKKNNKIRELDSIASAFKNNLIKSPVDLNSWFIATDDRPLVESLFDAMFARIILN